MVTRTSDYNIDTVVDSDLNVADQGGRGIDTEIRYSYDSGYGQWQATILWAHMLERSKTAFPGSDEQRLEGTYTNVTGEDGGAYAENKINYSLQWMRNDFSIGYMGEYISSLTTLDAGFIGDYEYTISDQLYHDIVASYTLTAFGSSTTIAAGVTNITDEAPPYIDLGFNGKTDVAAYRLFGTGYYVRASWKF